MDTEQAPKARDWRAEQDARNAEIDAELAALGITYAAEFVPQRFSRNADDKQPSLNWRVSIRREGKKGPALVTDYMQGVGHLVWKRKCTHPALKASLESLAAQNGRSGGMGSGGYCVAQTPALRDVLHTLMLDMNGTDQSFEEWAGEYGMDTDSRKAEATYRACQEIARTMRRLFTAAELSSLTETFIDY
jgi:hypothetical protein